VTFCYTIDMKKPLSIYALSFIFIGLFCGAIVGMSEVSNDHVLAEDDVVQQVLPSVSVVTPKSNDIIHSPLEISGKARGTWFFEGSFPIEIIDSNGTNLGTGIAHAEGDWMTEAYVPFDATITFITATSSTHGFILYKKDNPSGLPEHDATIALPVTFSK
jgi:hypothetical protein